MSQIEEKKLNDIKSCTVGGLYGINDPGTSSRCFTSSGPSSSGPSNAMFVPPRNISERTVTISGNTRAGFPPLATSTSTGITNQGPTVNTTNKAAPFSNPDYMPFRPPRPQLGDNNMYNSKDGSPRKTGLRPIIIDGSNVAIEHAKQTTDPSRPTFSNRLTRLSFSARGIQIVVDYFKNRGHKEIFVFIPNYRAHHCNTLNPEILEKLDKEGKLSVEVRL